ncbi:hypothetical protein [Actinomycetospora termitidis]|uniref:Uncharacterized protein n=1 Tax=Actinomycetospora termitidis TaxID=3053470 RepID=A0ABT7MFF4_9PSEU|nr:hypothetical protein [Actinomycetospora sp. Odt1-22]MDL5158909.1 hypothetical protein [Actinomycetospora sp. Odt1-22]
MGTTVEVGMSTGEVGERLGRPPRRALVRSVGSASDQELWIYPDREILFDGAGRACEIRVLRPPTRWVIADGTATAFPAR